MFLLRSTQIYQPNLRILSLNCSGCKILGKQLKLWELRWNPPGNWIILIFSGQKPCTRIIKAYCILS